MSRSCQFGRIFRRCPDAPAGVCQYCGRDFCRVHGACFDNGEEICGRSICRAKRVDVQAHLAYREAAQARSARGFCAEEGCGEPRWGQCSKCEALFCEQHLHDRDENIRRGLGVTARPASLCEHCWSRRKLWSRA